MTNTGLLDARIARSGLKLGRICEYLGITYLTFQRKRNNEVDFTATEIDNLCKVLKISSPKERMEIFFASKVNK